MRTTIDIDDQVLERIRDRARHQHIPAGRLISELLRRQLDQPPNVILTNGIPVLQGKAAGTLSEIQAAAMIEELLREESGL